MEKPGPNRGSPSARWKLKGLPPRWQPQQKPVRGTLAVNLVDGWSGKSQPVGSRQIVVPPLSEGNDQAPDHAARGGGQDAEVLADRGPVHPGRGASPCGRYRP